MDDIDLELVGRVRRAFPRNGDVLALCKFVELMLGNPKRVAEKLSDEERRRRNREYVRAHRARKKVRVEERVRLLGEALRSGEPLQQREKALALAELRRVVGAVEPEEETNPFE